MFSTSMMIINFLLIASPTPIRIYKTIFPESKKTRRLKTTTTEMTKALTNQNPNHNVGWPWPIDWPDELVVFNKHTGREVTFRRRSRGFEPREYFSLDDEFLIKIIFE